MKRSIFIPMMLLIALVGCGKGSQGSGSPNQSGLNAQTTQIEDDSVTGAAPLQNEVANKSISSTSSLPSAALSFKTNVSLMGFNSSQASKYNQAIAIVKKVVATEAFRGKVLNFAYGGAKQFANNIGKTNSQIYQSILDAAEKLKPIKNNTIDLGVKLYYAANSVVGYTNPSITYINVNTKFFNTYSANQVAGNLFHEWLHKLGYDHDSSPTSRRPYSVPYAIGYMIRDLGKNFL